MSDLVFSGHMRMVAPELASVRWGGELGLGPMLPTRSRIVACCRSRSTRRICNHAISIRGASRGASTRLALESRVFQYVAAPPLRASSVASAAKFTPVRSSG
jgi:hypothetical protein